MGFLRRLGRRVKRDGLYETVIYLAIRVYAKLKAPFLVRHYSKSTPEFGLNKTENREKKVIVSLTSYPARFPLLHICVKSLLSQSYKPDKIILYLGTDTEKEQVSDNILQLVPFGLEIAHRPDNLKPHNKYFFAMQEYPDDIVITVDDDLIYDRDLVLSLIQSYQRYPHAVSARRAHKITKDDNGIIKMYQDFLLDYRKERQPSLQLLATGVSGVLYPPKCLPSEAFDSDLIRKLCLNADDIWLKFMQIRNQVPVVWVFASRLRSQNIIIPNTQEIALFKTNNRGSNDVDTYIAGVGEYFSIDLADLFRNRY